jgi:hypothetical protein
MQMNLKTKIVRAERPLYVSVHKRNISQNRYERKRVNTPIYNVPA